MPLLQIRHTPQEHPVGCLAACAQMALAHLGRTVSQSRLNRLFERTSLGVPFPRIQRLRQLKVDVQLRNNGSEQDIRDAIDNGLPVITPVMSGELTYWHINLRHAVLVVGHDDEYIYLNDPGFSDAPQQATWNEFMLARVDFDYAFAVITS